MSFEMPFTFPDENRSRAVFPAHSRDPTSIVGTLAI